MAIETKTFARATPVDAQDMREALAGTLDEVSVHTIPGAVELRAEWTGVNDAAVAAIVAGVVDRDAGRRARRVALQRVELENDDKLRAIVLWIAQLHGKTPAEARDELRAILAGLT